MVHTFTIDFHSNFSGYNYNYYAVMFSKSYILEEKEALNFRAYQATLVNFSYHYKHTRRLRKICKYVLKVYYEVYDK